MYREDRLDLIEQDRLINRLFTKAEIAYFAGAAFAGVAAGEASKSVIVGVATGLAVSATGYGKTRLATASYLSEYRASITDAGSVVHRIDQSTNRIVAAIEGLGGPEEPPQS